MKRFKWALSLFIFWGLYCNAQSSYIISDSLTKQPIELVNAIVIKQNKGVSSNKNGTFVLNIQNINDDDTIAITHINYHSKFLRFREFKTLDTIFLSPQIGLLTGVIVKTGFNSKTYRHKNKLGYIHQFPGSWGFLPGTQIGLKLENENRIEGFISKVRLHFQKLGPNAHFRIRLKKIKEDGKIGDDLVLNGIIIKPKSRKPTIDLTEYSIWFPSNGIFVFIDNLGDYENSSNNNNEPFSYIRMTNKFLKPLTYNNYRDAYEWKPFGLTFKGKYQNAQIQIMVLSK